MKILISLLFLFSISIQAQLSIYPHQEGNHWTYYGYDGWGLLNVLQKNNIKDSVDAQENHFVTQETTLVYSAEMIAAVIDTSLFKIDTLQQVFGPHLFSDSLNLIYKLNAEPLDSWIIFGPEFGMYELAIVENVWEDELFGITTYFIEITYYNSVDSSALGGQIWYTDTFAFGFGLVQRYYFHSQTWLELQGCIIDNSLYGDTTTVVTSIKDHPLGSTSFRLFNNYPNPFNPTTKIKFTVPRHGGQANAADAFNESTTNVLLKVYDVLGNEITTLVDEQKPPGVYEVEFDGSYVSRRISSGIYFYSLTSGKFHDVKKMILMK